MDVLSPGADGEVYQTPTDINHLVFPRTPAPEAAGSLKEILNAVVRSPQPTSSNESRDLKKITVSNVIQQNKLNSRSYSKNPTLSYNFPSHAHIS